MSLGDKITALRKQRGWTQGILAEKAGVHTNHVSRWETNRMRPSANTLRRLAELFKITLDDLLDQEQPPLEVASKNHELAEKIRQIQELSPEDRAALFRIIDIMAAHVRVERLVASRHPE